MMTHNAQHAFRVSTKMLLVQPHATTVHRANITMTQQAKQKAIANRAPMIRTRMEMVKLCSVTAYAILDSMKMTQLQVRVQGVQQGRIV